MVRSLIAFSKYHKALDVTCYQQSVDAVRVKRLHMAVSLLPIRNLFVSNHVDLVLYRIEVDRPRVVHDASPTNEDRHLSGCHCI